ncbi:MAG: DUF5615 family PIN-like protein [Acidobacteria bacterium]|nr:DUF5615 family PIN-like protein [Acidobacteriota bacterium]
MARLYADEHFPLRVVKALRLMGHDVLTTKEAGQANKRIPDDQALAFACSEGRAILTYNRRNFIALHKSEPNHSGIIVCTVESDPIRLANRINDAIEQLSSLDGQLIRIIRPSK